MLINGWCLSRDPVMGPILVFLCINNMRGPGQHLTVGPYCKHLTAVTPSQPINTVLPRKHESYMYPVRTPSYALNASLLSLTPRTGSLPRFLTTPIALCKFDCRICFRLNTVQCAYWVEHQSHGGGAQRSQPPQMTNQCHSLTQWLDSTCQLNRQIGLRSKQRQDITHDFQPSEQVLGMLLIMSDSCRCLDPTEGRVHLQPPL